MSPLEVLLFAFSAIGEIVKAARLAGDGSITPEEALKRMGDAVHGPATVDARVAAALDEKFGPPDTDEGGK